MLLSPEKFVQQGYQRNDVRGGAVRTREGRALPKAGVMSGRSEFSFPRLWANQYRAVNFLPDGFGGNALA
jgi:hypothetical protein